VVSEDVILVDNHQVVLRGDLVAILAVEATTLVVVLEGQQVDQRVKQLEEEDRIEKQHKEKEIG
jgi:hypothetical protein